MQVFHLPTSVKALIFDIDNTLYANEHYGRLQVELLIRRFAQRFHMSFEEAQSIIVKEKKTYAAGHEGSNTSIGNIMAMLGVSIEENAGWRDELFKPEDFLKPDERTIGVVNELSSCFAIAAVTNNTTAIGRRTLAALGLESLFPLVVGLDSCFVSKPAKEPFELVLSELQVSPQHSISLGDRYDVDLKVPLSMGMGGILVESLADLYELPELLCGRQK